MILCIMRGWYSYVVSYICYYEINIIVRIVWLFIWFCIIEIVFICFINEI